MGFLQRDDSIAAADATQSTPWFCVTFSHDCCSQILPQDPYPKTQIITLFLGVAGFRNSRHHGNVTQFAPFNLPFSGLGSQELGKSQAMAAAGAMHHHQLWWWWWWW